VEAEAIFRESLTMSRTMLGEAHPSIAASLNGLAIAMRDQGRNAAAEPVLREALAMIRGTGIGIGSQAPRLDRSRSVAL
jgi:hypothetical protein